MTAQKAGAVIFYIKIDISLSNISLKRLQKNYIYYKM